MQNNNKSPEMFNNPHLFAQSSTPLENRINEEKPQLAPAIQRLKQLLGDAKFNAYINPLHNINKSGQRLLILTGNERSKTLLEKECLPELKAAFAVQSVRIVSMR